MFEKIKERIGEYLVRKNLKKTRKDDAVNFSHFFEKSKYVMVVVPKEGITTGVKKTLNFLKENGKQLTVVVSEPMVNLLNDVKDVNIISYSEEDLTKLKLPTKQFMDKFRQKEYDLVIDLNKTKNLFCVAVSNYVNSKFRVGYKKEDSDIYYNFQVPAGLDTNNPEDKIIESLKMF